MVSNLVNNLGNNLLRDKLTEAMDSSSHSHNKFQANIQDMELVAGAANQTWACSNPACNNLECSNPVCNSSLECNNLACNNLACNNLGNNQAWVNSPSTHLKGSTTNNRTNMEDMELLDNNNLESTYRSKTSYYIV